MRCRRLPGLPILTIDTGDHLGRIRRAVVDSTKKRVAAFLVATRSRPRRQLLPMEKVHALGGHAVTVTSLDALRPVKESVALAPLLHDRRVDVFGLPVVTAKGELVGLVRDFEVEEGGAIAMLFVTRGIWHALSDREPAVPGAMLLALGKDAVVVHEEALRLVEAERDRRNARPAEPAERVGRLWAMRKAVHDRLNPMRSARDKEEEQAVEE